MQAADNNLTNKQNNQQRLAFNEVRQPYPSMVRSIAKDTDLEKFSIDDALFLLEEKLKGKKGSISKKTYYS